MSGFQRIFTCYEGEMFFFFSNCGLEAYEDIPKVLENIFVDEL